MLATALLFPTTAAWGQCTTLPEADQILTFDVNFGNFTAVGDFTGDGIDDLVASRIERNSMHLDLMAGSPTGLSRVSTIPNFAASYAWLVLTAADVSGDGIDDLIVSTGAMLEVLLGSPNGLLPGFVAIVPDYFIGAFPVGDVTGDGIDDLLVFHGFDGTFQPYNADIYPGGPTGFGAVFSNGMVARETNPLRAIGDIDNDGSIDLVLRTWSGDITLFRSGPSLPAGAGALRSILIPRHPAMSYVNTVLPLSDLDGDGLHDLVVVGDDRASQYYTTTTASGPIGTAAEVHLTRLSGATEPSSFLQVATDLYAFATVSLGDRDGDGLDEIAFGSAYNIWDNESIWSGNIQVFEIGPGGYAPRELLQSNSPCGIVQPTLHAGDFNGDGTADLASPLPYLSFQNSPTRSGLLTFFSDPAAPDPTEPTPTTPTEPTPTGPTDATDRTDPDEPPEADRGCTCRAGSGPMGLWLLALVPVLWRRRRG